mgnify:CR=1 FL=1
MSKVRKSAEFVASKSTNVTVNAEGCRSMALAIKQRMSHSHYSHSNWSAHTLNPDMNTPGVVDWIFTIDTLNFSFWSDEPKFEVKYQGNNYTGYWSLVAAINRALDENIPITCPMFWCTDEFNMELIRKIFRSENEASAPLLEERFNVLREAGEALKKSGFKSFEDVLRSLNSSNPRSALAVVDWVTSNIGSYDDTALYKNVKVYIYKRAQILVGDIWACFHGTGFGEFEDINEITMFADYRVPQILYANNCIEYSPHFHDKIQKKVMMESGSCEEVEIRECSIWAVELIVNELNNLGVNINAVLADFYLWDTAKEKEKENTRIIECHRVRSVFY